MKTIKELHDTGELSTRTYNCVRRNMYRHFDGRMCREEIEAFTIKDILDMFGDRTLLSWRNFGVAALQELKGLA